MGKIKQDLDDFDSTLNDLAGYLTIQQVAKIKDCSISTITKKCKSKEIPSVKFGSQILIRKEDLGKIHVDRHGGKRLGKPDLQPRQKRSAGRNMKPGKHKDSKNYNKF